MLTREQSLRTPQEFQDDPSSTWIFYHHLRETMRLASPNPGHYALALLEAPTVSSRIAPSLDKKALVITQNIDRLSVVASHRVRSFHALDPPASPEDDTVVQMHGELWRTECLSCRHSKLDLSSPICSSLAGTERDFGTVELPKIERDRLPRCGGEGWAGSNRYGRCGGLLRPGVVWFGEVPYVGEIGRFLAHCDLLLVVGTSSVVGRPLFSEARLTLSDLLDNAQVHPAASYAAQVKRQGGHVAVFNSTTSAGDQDADFLFIGPCEQTLPSVLGLEKEVEEVMAAVVEPVQQA